MTKQCNNFMERMEAKIGNYNQPLFDGMHPDRVYCGAFWYTNDADDSLLTYGEEIQDQKDIEIN